MSWEGKATIVLGIYLLILNIIGFALMGIDKKRAKKRDWRISEAALFGAALLGGSLGSLIGMYLFRHKTRRWYFVWGIPAILAVQLVLNYLLFRRLSITYL